MKERMSRLYFDNNATTFLDPAVKAVIGEHLAKNLGNPSSVHTPGTEAKTLLNKARQTIALSLGVKNKEILFTSGGTEGLNTLLRQIFSPHFKGHLISSTVEHSALFSTALILQSYGISVSLLEPGFFGAVTAEKVKKALRPDTRLIALMAVNNETGVKTDIEAIGAIAKEANVPFLVDGVALFGKEPFVIPEGVTAMCFSGHKFHAPLGIGFSYLKSTFNLEPLISGGDQEFGRRGGTENLLGIVGLAEAVQQVDKHMPAAQLKMQRQRDFLENSLLQNIQGVSINGTGPRISNTSNLAFDDIEGETLLMRLDREGISVSHGSACASGALEPSRILLNMGLSKKQAASSIRISLSRFTTDEEMEKAIQVISATVTALRKKG